MTRNERLILGIAVGASFVAFMNNTIITVALPKITADLGGGLTGQQWMINAYLVTLGSLILVAGSVSDVLGRGVVLRAGLAGFALASVADRDRKGCAGEASLRAQQSTAEAQCTGVEWHRPGQHQSTLPVFVGCARGDY